MIWVSDIVDSTEKTAVPCAQLRYDDEAEKFSIHIADDASPEHLPLILAAFAERGQRTLDDQWSRRWVAERIAPPGRQNLGEILKAHGLKYYDELALLESSRGESSNDDFVLALPAPENLASNERPMKLQAVPNPAARLQAIRSWGASLAEARKALGMSQGELARRMGVDQAFISRLENGKANPTLATLTDAASCLGLSLQVTLQGPSGE